MAGQYRIKQATTPGEIEAGVRVNAQAWQESFRGLLPDEVIDARGTVEEMTLRAERWARAAMDGAHFWLATDRSDGHAVGIASACPARESDAPQPLELATLFVLDEAKGTGLAEALMQTAIGDAPCYLWTLKGNDRAISFYHRLGFAMDGVRREAHHLVEGRPHLAPPIEVRLVRHG